MIKVLTYGTYDLLHHGHIRLLERAKALGEYLIVGVTADNFDKTRGKINVQQSLIERIENVRATGLADEIIVEEYEGQKIDDILKHGVDIFTVGSDWKGKFDYLRKYCQVIYLPRTEGVSSSGIRGMDKSIRISVLGHSAQCPKFIKESEFVNGVEIVGKLEQQEAYYIASDCSDSYGCIKRALDEGKHVLCESLISLNRQQCEELFAMALHKGLILMTGPQIAYATAYRRLLLLANSGKIGKILSVDVTCTGDKLRPKEMLMENSLSMWGATALLPVFQLLGVDYIDKTITTWLIDKQLNIDGFTKMDFVYKDSTASVKVGRAVKSEGKLIIIGTKGYINVPAPWWETDYFEVRYENASENQRYYYHLGGEGMRYAIMAFKKAIINKRVTSSVAAEVTKAICGVMNDFNAGKVNYIE